VKKKIVVTGGDDIFAYAKLLKNDFDFISLMPDVGKALEDLDIPNRTFNSFINEQVQAKASGDVARILVEVMAQVPQVVGKLNPNVAETFKAVIPGFILNQSQSIALLINTLDIVNPDGAIVHNDVEPVNRALAFWCKAHGKSCLHVPHAVYFNYERGAVGTDIHDVVTATHLAAAGPFQREWYEKRGFDPQHIVNTGIPRFDKIMSIPRNRERACSVLKLNYRKPTIVYFSSWGQQTNLHGVNNNIEMAYGTFLDAVKGNEDIEVVVKCHPRGRNVPWHTQEAQKRGVRCVVTDQYLEMIAQTMTAGICYGPSNIILSSSLFNVPLAVTGGFNEDNEILKIHPDVDSIRKGITLMLSSSVPNYTNFWLKYMGVPDGLAAQRVAKYARIIFA
jgi:hypothetical protein